MTSPTPADLAQWAVNAATVLAGLLGTVAATVKFVAWWKDRRIQARLESAKALAARELDDGLKAWGQQQLDRIHFARLSGIDRYDGYKALLACHQELGGTDSAWRSLRGVGPHLLCRKGFAWVRKLRRKDYTILAVSLVVFGIAAAATATLLAVSVAFGYAWFASGVILERLISLLLLGYGIAVCAMLAYGSASIGNCYGNALQLRRRLFKIRALSRALRALRTGPW
jgi:hypothetical protein